MSSTLLDRPPPPPPLSVAQSSESDVYVDSHGPNSNSDDDFDGESSDQLAIFTDVSDISGSSTRKYKWRKKLQGQKHKSMSRHQHKLGNTAPRLNPTASSLPDLELYKTWDPRTTLKVGARVHFPSVLISSLVFVKTLTRNAEHKEIEKFQDSSEGKEKSASAQKGH